MRSWLKSFPFFRFLLVVESLLKQKKKKDTKQKEHLQVWGNVASLAHNLNWELYAEQVFLVIVSQFPLHSQLYLEKQKRH